MNRFILIATVAALVPFAAFPAVRHLHAIEVVEGSSFSVTAENALEVKTGNPSVASASIRENEVSVLGSGIGQTDLFFIDTRGVFADAKVTVRPVYWSVLKRLFEEDPEVNIEIVGGNVVLSGSTASSETLKRVAEAKALDPKRILSQVSYSPEALQVIVQDFINRSAISNISVQVIGREVCLRGNVYDKGAAQSLGERVKKFLVDFPQVVVNWEELKVYRQKISIGIEFVTWDDSRAKNLGLQLADNAIIQIGSGDLAGATFEKGGSVSSGSGTTGSGTGGGTSVGSSDGSGWNEHYKFGNSSFIKSTDGLKVTMNLAKKNGVAKKAYGTQLSTQSGEEVKFQNGGTRYMRVQGVGAGSAGDLRQFEYGYVISAKPVIVDHDTLNLDFDMDFSKINNEAEAKVSAGDYDIARFKTKSKYTMRPGESILLSGFDSVEEEAAKTGWPILSRIPVLNWIFGNRARSNAKSEMLLVVTVDWAVEDSEGALKRIKEVKDRKVEPEMP